MPLRSSSPASVTVRPLIGSPSMVTRPLTPAVLSRMPSKATSPVSRSPTVTDLVVTSKPYSLVSYPEIVTE